MADVDKVKLPDGTVYDVGGGGGSSISPYTSNPAMDGTASPGSSNDYSRGDHVHPHDTSRVPTSRTINGHSLSSNVTLDASDVGALPDTYTAPVSSVNGQTGAVVLDANDVGALPDTTPIPTNTSDLNNDSGFITANSPALTGTPTAPTAAAGTDSTQIATTEFVNIAVNSVVGQYSQTPNAVSVPSASNTTIANTGSLEGGYHYIILAKASFPANTTGRRVMFLATSNSGSNIDRFAIISMMPVSGTNVTTDMSMVYLCHPTTATTYYLRVYQNAGSTLNVTGGLRVFKFKVGQ